MVAVTRVSPDLVRSEAALGPHRAVLVARPDPMLVTLRLTAVAEGAPHSHAQVQASFVAGGTSDVTIEGATERASPGASVLAARNVVHDVAVDESGSDGRLRALARRRLGRRGASPTGGVRLCVAPSEEPDR